jgi:hypothetical protein
MLPVYDAMVRRSAFRTLQPLLRGLEDSEEATDTVTAEVLSGPIHPATQFVIVPWYSKSIALWLALSRESHGEAELELGSLSMPLETSQASMQ